MPKGMVSKYAGKCPLCDGPWIVGDVIFFNDGEQGYYDSTQCAEVALERIRATEKVSVPEPRYTPPAIEFARPDASNAAEEPCLTREERMEKMHEENILASANLTDAVTDFATAIRILTQELSWIGSKLKFPPQG